MQIQQKFVKTAKKQGKKVAIHDQILAKDFSYQQILIISLILSARFRKLDSTHIGILIPTSAGAILSILATFMAGKIPVMINYATGAENNCQYAQKKCQFTPIITSKKFLERRNIHHVPGMIFIEDYIGSITTVDKIIGLIKSLLPQLFIHKGAIEDDALILLTTGSEKDPKAVRLSHKNLLHNISSSVEALQYTENDLFITLLPLFHVFGFTSTCILPLTLGCSIVTQPNPLDYKSIVESVKKYRATTLVGTPTFLAGYLNKSQPGDFSSIRIIVAGADKVNLSLRQQFMEKHKLEILEGYGTTETSPVLTVNRPDNNRPGSIGLPIDGISVKIVDVASHKELPPKQEGKIMVRGNSVMKGYLGDPTQTEQVLQNGWYDTGDMGMLDEDGFLWHLGRYRRFIKVGGEMISLVAIEKHLEEILPQGIQCCVVSRPNPSKGTEIIVAITRQVDTMEIKRMLAKRLPPLAIPKDFKYFAELPIMGSGKINFREVERMCQQD